MANEMKSYSSFDELVFEHRNKDYGAYIIRKKYNRTVLIALLVAVISFTLAVFIPSIRAKHRAQSIAMEARAVIAEMAIELKQEIPPAPPPPPLVPQQPPEQQTVVKYVAPIVVDTIKPEDQSAIAVTDEQIETSENKEVHQVLENSQEDASGEVYGIVEEMPQFPGGEIALCKYIANSIKYPVVAQKTGIQGKVYVSFIVDKDGGVTDVKVLQGVDPLLDREALRVVRSLPRWKPGKQRGVPVKVSYTVPINFIL